MNNFQPIISQFQGKKILVLGDLILDQHIRGTVSRISPEAPVPVVLQEGHPSYTPGGAANVVNNLSSLGAKVTIIGLIGKDREGEILKEELKKRHVDISAIIEDIDFPTALKTRIIAQHQQLVRVDREKKHNGEDENYLNPKIADFIDQKIEDFDAVIISDYGKGLITPELVRKISTAAFSKNKIITVDPKEEHFHYYKGVTAITPNKKETENAIRNIKITQNPGDKLAIHTDKLATDEAICNAGQELLRYLELDSLLMTLGEHGMCLFEKGKTAPSRIATKAQEVYDVTGAGDTVISVFTLSLVCGATKHEAADLANSAAGVVVSKMGAVAITVEEIYAAVEGHE